MSIREQLDKNRIAGVAVGVALFVLAAIAFAVQFWPQRKPNLALQYFSDDDGQTWYSDEVSNVAPYDHNGKTAVIAEIYTYDDGSKKFCAYLAKYSPKAKEQLEAAIADAKSKGEPIDQVPLLHDPIFMRSNTLVKRPGPNNPWLAFTDPRASDVFSIHSPDGTTVDEAFVY